MGPIEVITSVQRRRRWAPEEKRAILEEENRKLQRIVADLTLDKHILQDVISTEL